jgi:hypothetical protein
MAEHSPDRQARAAAVECLHAVILWMVGEALHSCLRLPACLAFVSDVGSKYINTPSVQSEACAASALDSVLYACMVMCGVLVRICVTGFVCTCGHTRC